MRIDNRLCFRKMKRIVFIHIGIIYRYSLNNSQKHHMAAERNFLCHTALYMNRTFRNQRRFHFLCRKSGQIHFFKFINIPSASDATKIRRKRKLFRGQINHKFFGILYHLIGISGRSDRNGNHRWVRTYSTCPRNCKDIVIPLTICYGN